MESTEIKSYDGLRKRILLLQEAKQESKEELKESFSEMLGVLKPGILAKNALTELFHDKQVQQDLTQLGLTFGSNMLIATLMGKNKSFFRYAGSSVVQHFVTELIQNSTPLIMNYVDLLVSNVNSQISDIDEESHLTEADYFAQYAQ